MVLVDLPGIISVSGKLILVILYCVGSISSHIPAVNVT